jgi:hypothetical protein
MSKSVRGVMAQISTLMEAESPKQGAPVHTNCPLSFQDNYAEFPFAIEMMTTKICLDLNWTFPSPRSDLPFRPFISKTTPAQL